MSSKSAISLEMFAYHSVIDVVVHGDNEQDVAMTLAVMEATLVKLMELRGKDIRVSHPGAFTFEYDEPNEPPVLRGELWKDVKGSKNAAVSSYGRVRNRHGVVSTPTTMQDGRVFVGAQPARDSARR